MKSEIIDHETLTVGSPLAIIVDADGLSVREGEAWGSIPLFVLGDRNKLDLLAKALTKWVTEYDNNHWFGIRVPEEYGQIERRAFKHGVSETRIAFIQSKGTK